MQEIIVDRKVSYLDREYREIAESLAWYAQYLRRSGLYDRLTKAPPEFQDGRECLSFIASCEYEKLEQDDDLASWEKECHYLATLSGAGTRWLAARQLPAHLAGRLIRSFLYCRHGFCPDDVRYLSKAATLLVVTASVQACIEKGEHMMQQMIDDGWR